MRKIWLAKIAMEPQPFYMYVWEKHCSVVDFWLLSTSPGERLTFWTDGVHWAEMLTFTLLNVFLDACSNT